MPGRTLIVGAGGMLGTALLAAASRRGYEVVAAERSRLDVTRRDLVERILRRVEPEVVVNCAALTAVDDCESRAEEALAVNGTAVGTLLAAARGAGARLVQVSTDFVFDGEARSPYDESDPPRPLSVYGRSKLVGERLALKAESSLVVRTSWLFGPGGRNFVATMADLLASGRKPLRVVADQTGCPTYTPYLADAIWDLIGLRSNGIVHYRNRGPVTWHEFASSIADRLGDEDEVEAVTSEELARQAPRPRYSVLDVGRFEDLTGRPVESWKPGLDEYLNLIREQRPS